VSEERIERDFFLDVGCSVGEKVDEFRMAPCTLGGLGCRERERERKKERKSEREREESVREREREREREKRVCVRERTE